MLPMLVLFHECFPLFHSNSSFISVGLLCVCHIFVLFSVLLFQLPHNVSAFQALFFPGLFCERSHSVPWCTQHAVQCSVYNIYVFFLLFSFVAVNDGTQLDWQSKFFIIFTISACMCMFEWFECNVYRMAKYPAKYRTNSTNNNSVKQPNFFRTKKTE